MRALTYHGSHDVRIETVDDPTIREADDIIVRVTASAICGTDLHLYRNKLGPAKLGDILGQEFIGEVVETGSAVTAVREGERIVVPSVIACGECFFCTREQHAACENMLPRASDSSRSHIAPGAAQFGLGHLHGALPGGHAEYVRVPKANVGPIRVPDSLDDDQAVQVGHTLAAAYQASLDAQIVPGQSVAIFGAGPTGLLVAACARMLGAERLFMVDHNAYRLAFAERTYGAQTINFDETDDPVASIIEHTAGQRGVDAAIDAVGFEAKASTLETVLSKIKFEPGNSITLRQCMAAVRRGGRVSVPGAYYGSASSFALTDAFEKGVTLNMGRAHILPYRAELLGHVEQGTLRPQDIISHRMTLEEAAAGYLIFDKRQEECRKVFLRP